MAFTPNDDLKRAIEALDIFRVWGDAYSDGVVISPPPPQQKDGQFKSPFREDGKRGSFSICHRGRGFQDFGGNGGKGGIYQFAEHCWSGLSGKELAQKLIALSGIVPTPPPLPPKPGETPAAAPVDPAIAKLAKAAEKRRLEREREDAIYEEREKMLEVKRKPTPAAWPKCVEDSYLEGVGFMRDNGKWIERLAGDRGWPIAWAAALVDLELVSYAWERWATPGDKFARRQKAFPVQALKLGRAGARNELVNVGYHQRFFVPAMGDKPETKGWLYVPSLPKSERARISALERGIIDATLARGVKLEEAGALVPPLPFVLGDIQAPRLIVLLEGQWDAISFFGACGWLHDTNPAEGIAVFGIRGAQGTEAFLSYWGEWLERVKPNAWLIADNDDAGETWRNPPPAEPGLPRPPSLAERLKAAKCRHVEISWLKRNLERPKDKDFNDYFKAAKPTPEQMFSWMRRRGLMDAGGSFV